MRWLVGWLVGCGADSLSASSTTHSNLRPNKAKASRSHHFLCIAFFHPDASLLNNTTDCRRVSEWANLDASARAHSLCMLCADQIRKVEEFSLPGHSVESDSHATVAFLSSGFFLIYFTLICAEGNIIRFHFQGNVFCI